MTVLAYKPNAEEVIRRLDLLYQRKATDRIFAVMEIPSPTLQAFSQRYTEGFCDYPDPHERIAFWDRRLAEHANVTDDSFPNAYLSEMDQGLYGGVLGGQVQFMSHPDSGWISSMVPALLDDWSGLASLRFDPAHPWFERFVRQLEVFAAGAGNKFGISHFILIDGLNFCFELVGATKTYLSLDEHPEMIRRAIEMAFDLNVKIQDAFFQRVPLVAGGTCSNMVEWVPGRIVSESVDPFHMTSVNCFETWGREPIERIFHRFDGGVVHIHANGRHLLEAVCSLTGLKALFLGDDTGFPSAFDILGQLRGRTADMPLVVQVDFPRFIDRLQRHALPGGVLYKVSALPDADTANRWMEKLRAYRL